MRSCKSSAATGRSGCKRRKDLCRRIPVSYTHLLGPTSGSFGLESGLDGDVDEEFHDGLEIDLLNADIDPDDFRLMDEEERLEALDDAGLDPDDYDDFF